MHLNISLEKLTRKYGVNVETHAPRIAYRETITKSAEGRGRHKKQSGGRGQFGDCHVRLSPLGRGKGYEFVSSIKGGVIPTKFIPAVNKGINSASTKGVLAGYPLVDFRAECYDGSHHAVDSSEIAFQIAGSVAFRKVALNAKPVILEPIMEVEVETPEEFMGDVIGKLNSKRGKIKDLADRAGAKVIRAEVPLSGMFGYSTDLRSATQGRANYSMEFAKYDGVPAAIAEELIAKATGAKEKLAV